MNKILKIEIINFTVLAVLINTLFSNGATSSIPELYDDGSSLVSVLWNSYNKRTIGRCDCGGELDFDSIVSKN